MEVHKPGEHSLASVPGDEMVEHEEHDMSDQPGGHSYGGFHKSKKPMR